MYVGNLRIFHVEQKIIFLHSNLQAKTDAKPVVHTDISRHHATHSAKGVLNAEEATRQKTFTLDVVLVQLDVRPRRPVLQSDPAQRPLKWVRRGKQDVPHAVVPSRRGVSSISAEAYNCMNFHLVFYR
jgi:hypothetical protein